VEAVEMVVEVHIFGYAFPHSGHLLIHSCGVSVEKLVFQEKQRTADEISQRIMNGAAIARRDKK
jgi:hypothetical protein